MFLACKLYRRLGLTSIQSKICSSLVMSSSRRFSSCLRNSSGLKLILSGAEELVEQSWIVNSNFCRVKKKIWFIISSLRLCTCKVIREFFSKASFQRMRKTCTLSEIIILNSFSQNLKGNQMKWSCIVEREQVMIVLCCLISCCLCRLKRLGLLALPPHLLWDEGSQIFSLRQEVAPVKPRVSPQVSNFPMALYLNQEAT